jgi:hypothetical protein
MKLFFVGFSFFNIQYVGHTSSWTRSKIIREENQFNILLLFISNSFYPPILYLQSSTKNLLFQFLYPVIVIPSFTYIYTVCINTVQSAATGWHAVRVPTLKKLWNDQVSGKSKFSILLLRVPIHNSHRLVCTTYQVQKQMCCFVYIETCGWQGRRPQKKKNKKKGKKRDEKWQVTRARAIGLNLREC